MTATILPFGKRGADGVIHVPPPEHDGTVYLFFGKMWPRQRKKRWLIAIEFCDHTYEIEDAPEGWATAMFLARTRARKFGFRVIDLTKGGHH